MALGATAAFALSLTLAVTGTISRAGANVATAGTVAVSMDVSLVTPTLTLPAFATTSTATATIRADGSFTVPRPGIAFQPVTLSLGSPPALGDVNVSLVASSDFTGAVDPTTSTELLAGRVEMLWSQTGTMTGCPVGPFDVQLTTKSPGARPYASSSGTATMVDGNFAIDALKSGTPGCAGLESLINSTLSLPITTTTTTDSSTTTTSTTTTSTTTTTTPSTAMSEPVLLPDTPVPAVVVSTTLTPAPEAAPTSTSRPTTTTAKRTTTTPQPSTTTTTTTKSRPIKKVARTLAPPKPKRHHVNRHKSQTNPHKKHHPKRHHHKRHKQHLAKPAPKTIRRATNRLARNTITTAAPRNYGYLGRGTPRSTARTSLRRPYVTPFAATLASSRHHAPFSALTLLEILAVVVSGWYVFKLVRPDFDDLVHARSVRRRRLYGIDPPGDRGI